MHGCYTRSNSESARNNSQHWKRDKLQTIELNIVGSCYFNLIRVPQ